MSATVYTQAEVDALVAAAKADAVAQAKAADLAKATVDAMIAAAIAGIPAASTSGTTVIVSATQPANVANGTVWVKV